MSLDSGIMADDGVANTFKRREGSILPPLLLGGAVVVGAGCVWLATRYRVASASQYIVRTGLGISSVSISKKAFQYRFQTAVILSMNPRNYMFGLSAMSREKCEFSLPGIFTIGPEDKPESLHKFVTLLDGGEDKSIDDIIKGVIEGETRVLAATLEIEEIFNGRDAFRDKIIATVQDELSQFGLKIYNVRFLHSLLSWSSLLAFMAL